MQPLEDFYTLDDYIAATKRRSSVFFLVALPIVAIATVFAVVIPDEYRSVARIAINLEGTNIRTLEPIQVATYADQYIAEIRDRVQSSENLTAFAQESKAFDDDDGLSVQDRIGILEQGFYFSLETQSVTTANGREVDLISGFRAGFEDSDPEFAAEAARFFAKSFLREDHASRTERASSTSAFLAKQINDTEARIVAHENEAANFKVVNACCLPELKELNMGIIQRAERDIEALQPRIRTLEQDRIFLQAQLEDIREKSASTDRLAELEQEYLQLVANYGQDHPDVGRVRREIEAITNAGPISGASSELQMLRIKLVEAEHKYSDIHPDVLKLKRRIATIESISTDTEQVRKTRLIENPRFLQLRTEINSTDTELTGLRLRRPELRKRIDDYEDRLRKTPQVESEYLALNRKLATERDNFDNMQQRLAIARQTEALESTEIGARLSEIRSAKFPNSPSGPPRLAIIIIGIFLAGSLGVGTIILAEILDSTIRSSKDIFRVIEITPIATIPVVQNSLSRANWKHKLILISSLSLLALVVTSYFIFVTLA